LEYFGLNFGFENNGLNLPHLSDAYPRFMRKLFLLLPVFLICLEAWSQSVPEGYQRAQVLLNSRSYWDALNSFKEFTSVEKYGNLANYASFHAGEAAIGANQPAQAIEFLQPLVSRNWKGSQDAEYLLATAYFQNNQALEALRAIAKIEDSALQEKAQDLSFEYLSKSNPNFLISNLKEFENQSAYKAALGTVLKSKTVLSSEEKALYYEMQGIGANASSGQLKDDVLDIVVILPFTDTGNGQVSPSSFTYELFQGIRFAVNKMKREGVKVNLSTFDSQRDLNHLRSVLQEPAVAKADVILGPIYPDESDLVSAFAENAKIPFVHPLSNLGERFVGKQYSYLFRPSAQNLVEGIIKNLKGKAWGNRVAIGYSGSSRDEKMAALLNERLPQEGFQIVGNTKLDPRNASTFLSDLGVRPGKDSVNLDVDQVVLLTDDPTIAQPTLALVESVTTTLPILVMDSWLGFNFANYEMLEFPNFYFISNNSPALDSEAMNSFKSEFYGRNLAFPTLNAVLGRELVYWVSQNLKPTFGFDLRRSLNQQVYEPGKLTWGFNFQNSNSNQYVPVFSIETGELKPLLNQ